LRHGIVVWAFVLAAGLLFSGDLSAGSLEPPGPPAPTMKTLSEVEPRTPISSLPFTISTPGSFYLTGNLTGMSGQAGITIASSFVTLDLNGFSLIGVPGSLDGIRTVFGGSEQIAIHNGVIRDWGGNGVSAFTYVEIHIEDLRVHGNGNNGVVVGGGSFVRDTSSTGNAVTGIVADVGTSVIGCTARNNASIGISLSSGSMATDCTAQFNGTGFDLALGSRVVHSVSRLNTTGITGSDGVSIEECTVDRNTNDGIRVVSRGLVRGNVARANAADGIQATGNENRIEDNESSTNGVGIQVNGSSNLIIKNSVSGNTTLEYSVSAGNKFAPVSIDPATAGPWANFDL